MRVGLGGLELRAISPGEGLDVTPAGIDAAFPAFK